MIYLELTRSMFHDAFKNAGRGEQYTYDGLNALYDYLDILGDEEGHNLDVSSICCDFARIDIKNIPSQTDCHNLGELENTTTVLRVDDDSIIYLLF